MKTPAFNQALIDAQLAMRLLAAAAAVRLPQNSRDKTLIDAATFVVCEILPRTEGDTNGEKF